MVLLSQSLGFIPSLLSRIVRLAIDHLLLATAHHTAFSQYTTEVQYPRGMHVYDPARDPLAPFSSAFDIGDHDTSWVERHAEYFASGGDRGGQYGNKN